MLIRDFRVSKYYCYWFSLTDNYDYVSIIDILLANLNWKKIKSLSDISPGAFLTFYSVYCDVAQT